MCPDRLPGRYPVWVGKSVRRRCPILIWHPADKIRLADYHRRRHAVAEWRRKYQCAAGEDVRDEEPSIGVKGQARRSHSRGAVRSDVRYVVWEIRLAEHQTGVHAASKGRPELYDAEIVPVCHPQISPTIKRQAYRCGEQARGGTVRRTKNDGDKIRLAQHKAGRHAGGERRPVLQNAAVEVICYPQIALPIDRYSLGSANRAHFRGAYPLITGIAGEVRLADHDAGGHAVAEGRLELHDTIIQ